MHKIYTFFRHKQPKSHTHTSESVSFNFRVPEVCSHRFQIKIVCFERLIESLDSVFAMRDHYVTEMKSTSHAIFTFRREQNISFSLYKQGTDARRLHYFNGLVLRAKAGNVVRNEVDYLGGID